MTAYDPKDSLLLTLRETAKAERDKLIRYNLRLVADELADAIAKFTAMPNGANLATLNGRWAHGIRMLNFAGNRNDSGGRGAGLKEGAKLAQVA